jgi:hypothetical protein
MDADGVVNHEFVSVLTILKLILISANKGGASAPIAHPIDEVSVGGIVYVKEGNPDPLNEAVEQ